MLGIRSRRFEELGGVSSKIYMNLSNNIELIRIIKINL
jgi:hypothetical protein